VVVDLFPIQIAKLCISPPKSPKQALEQKADRVAGDRNWALGKNPWIGLVLVDSLTIGERIEEK